MFYIVRLDINNQKSYMLGQYNTKKDALESLHVIRKSIKNKQILIDDQEEDETLCIYSKNTGIFFTTKSLVEKYQIIEYPQSELTKNIKNQVTELCGDKTCKKVTFNKHVKI